MGARSRAIALAGALLAGVAGIASSEAASSGATSGPWAVPESGSCQPEGGLHGFPGGEDAPPVPFRPGDVLEVGQLTVLRAYLPPELWRNRDRFFYEGMRLEIGPCFADYSAPAFFQAATERHRGSARLDEEGGLRDYSAGLPFVPDDIDPGDPRAGLFWAWNMQLRYRAAGMRGDFRISDMVGREGRAEPFLGKVFQIQLAHRSDRPDDEYVAKGARGKHWVAGGQFDMPFDARGHAWRQYRDVENQREPKRTDDLHAYLPDSRRVRRLSAAGVEGLYMPSYAVGVVKPASIAGLGVGETGAAAGMATPDSITTKRSGFEGLEIRPLLYDWKVVGVQDVLAPINANVPSYPEVEDRSFGPWGLSFASDRWDLRRALVLEGKARASRGAEEVSRLVAHVDLQTLVPLYYTSFDARDESIDVGLYVGRWSEDREDYPRWPDDPEREIRVIDSAGAAFANLSDIGGWRRETWDMVSTPPSDRVVRRLVSVSNLTKGR